MISWPCGRRMNSQIDDVQRKLIQIDKQLAYLPGLHKQLFTTAPLLFVAIGLVVGIIVQDRFSLPGYLWLTLLAVCAAATAVFAIIKSKVATTHLFAYLALICFVSLGAVRLIAFYRPAADDVRALVTDKEVLATIRGRIVTRPFINENTDWEFAKFQYTDPSTSFYLKLTEIETADGWTKVSGTVRVQVNEPVLDIKTGDCIQGYCRLDRFKEPGNPVI